MRQAVARHPDFPATLLFFQGTGDAGETFFQRLWPEARAVSDLPGSFYHAFGLRQGGLKETLGPAVWASSLRALAKGAFVGKPTGDVRLMPGVFLVQGNQILWRHAFRHIGDQPDWAQIPALVQQHA